MKQIIAALISAFEEAPEPILDERLTRTLIRYEEEEEEQEEEE